MKEVMIKTMFRLKLDLKIYTVILNLTNNTIEQIKMINNHNS